MFSLLVEVECRLVLGLRGGASGECSLGQEREEVRSSKEVSSGGES